MQQEPLPASAWGADDGSWATAAELEGEQEAWLSRVADAEPPRREYRPIEAVTVGEVDVPFNRRNGYHVDVRVQHEGGAPESAHRLWVAREVLIEVAALKGRRMEDLDAGELSEAIVDFLKHHATPHVDLADPEWAMNDESVPFSSEFFAARTLLNYYPELKQWLANKLLDDVPADVERPEPETILRLDDVSMESYAPPRVVPDGEGSIPDGDGTD